MADGYLIGFRYFPFNVLLKIFSYLYPQDLLNLDRTCLELHRVLLDNRCWERTFQNVGLPHCPSDLSPHQYATLVFNPLCQFCYRSRGTKVYWLCRVRCCNKCLYINFRPYVGCSFPDPYDFYVPYVLVGKERLFRPEDIERFETQLLQSMEDAVGDNTFLRQAKAMMAERFQHVRLCMEWQDSYASNPREKHAFRERRESIVAKLTDLGWGEELALMDPVTEDYFSNLHEVRQRQKLSSRTWKVIRDGLVNFLQGVRTKRLARLWLAALSDRLAVIGDLYELYLSHCPIEQPQPSLADICTSDYIHQILELPDNPTDISRTLSDLYNELPGITESWRLNVSRRLLQLMPPCNGAIYNPLHRLELATTFFFCALGCPEPLGFPRVLVHKCASSVVQAPTFELVSADRTQALSATLGEEPWNSRGDRIAFNPKASSAAHRIVEIVGLDPYYTTAKRMDELDVWFGCSLCSTDELKCLMSWDAAVFHAVGFHQENICYLEWLVLPTCPVEAEDVRTMMSMTRFDYRCTLCGKYLSLEMVPSHIQEKHKHINSENAYDFCYRHLDAPPPNPIMIRMEVLELAMNANASGVWF